MSMTEPPFETIDTLEDPDRSGSPAPLLLRVDLNSPIEDGTVKDNRRFARHAETVAALLDRSFPVVILAHQGRPGGDGFVSLEGHASILGEHLGRPVEFCRHHSGPRAERAIQDLAAGSALLLENVRMNPDELVDRPPADHAASDFVRSLASTAGAYVGDAYSAAHRPHASIVGFPLAMDIAVAGRVMEREYVANSAIQSRTFDGPVRMVLGGTKADDLVRVMRGVDETVDEFLCGGVIGELFLRARGHDVGYDVGDTELFDPLWAEHADTIRDLESAFGDRLVLPTDLAFEEADGDRKEVPVEGVSKHRPYLDVGEGTVARFADRLGGSAAVFVKGALGVFEDERFSLGTVETLRAIAESDAFSVVGGGDTSRVVDLYDLDAEAFDHVSIAGGAYVRALAGETFPGVDALRR